MDITAITSAARYNGMTIGTASSILGTSGTSSASDLVSTSSGLASLSSNGTDLVSLSAQALLDETSEVTGLGEGADMSDLFSGLSTTAIGGLLDSTSDLAVLSAVFGSSSTDDLLLGVVSATSGG
jgi:hypothetical protein